VFSELGQEAGGLTTHADEAGQAVNDDKDVADNGSAVRV
jgi:hypothetical protein